MVTKSLLSNECSKRKGIDKHKIVLAGNMVNKDSDNISISVIPGVLYPFSLELGKTPCKDRPCIVL